MQNAKKHKSLSKLFISFIILTFINTNTFSCGLQNLARFLTKKPAWTSQQEISKHKCLTRKPAYNLNPPGNEKNKEKFLSEVWKEAKRLGIDKALKEIRFMSPTEYIETIEIYQKTGSTRLASAIQSAIVFIGSDGHVEKKSEFDCQIVFINEKLPINMILHELAHIFQIYYLPSLQIGQNNKEHEEFADQHANIILAAREDNINKTLTMRPRPGCNNGNEKPFETFDDWHAATKETMACVKNYVDKTILAPPITSTRVQLKMPPEVEKLYRQANSFLIRNISSTQKEINASLLSGS